MARCLCTLTKNSLFVAGFQLEDKSQCCFSTAVSDSVLLLFGGSISEGDSDGHLKMLGGYLEFFMQPAVPEMYQSLRGQLDELIQTKLLNPRMDIHMHHELLSAVRLLVS